MAIVRAKRLVFEATEDKRYLIANTAFGTYQIRESVRDSDDETVWWWSFRHGAEDCEGTCEEAVAACQSDFHARWLADTEVVPLEWRKFTSDQDDLQTRHWHSRGVNEDYIVRESPDGTCEWSTESTDEEWQPCDSVENGQQLSNNHNRTAILGG